MSERIFNEPFPEPVQHQEPSVYIPNDREIDPTERGQLIARFKDEFVALNPGASDWDINAASEKFRVKIIRSGPAGQEIDNRIKARETERQAALAEAERKAESEVKAKADAELESVRQTMLASWRENGGTDAEFADRWPALRLEIIESRTMQAQQDRLRQSANTTRVN